MNQKDNQQTYRLFRKIGVGFIFSWFVIGGAMHFASPDVFLKTVPPDLPLRMQAVYISGFFELLGAIGLLHPATRRLAGIGLFLLTIAVTPANVYMWLNPQLFPSIPAIALMLRLPLQLVLLYIIWKAVISLPSGTPAATVGNSVD